MRRLVHLIVLAALAGPAWGDPPASFMPFERKSPNERFVAAVTDHPWTLAVYERVPVGNKIDRIKKWSAPFEHHGYPELMVADDGQLAAYVEAWHRGDDAVAVELYRPTAPVGRIKFAAFHVPTSALMRTTGHLLWMRQEKTRFEDGALVIETLDRRIHRIDPRTGALATEPGPPVTMPLGKRRPLPLKGWTWASSRELVDAVGPGGERLWVTEGGDETLALRLGEAQPDEVPGRPSTLAGFADGIAWCAVPVDHLIYALGRPAAGREPCVAILADPRLGRVVKHLPRAGRR